MNPLVVVTNPRFIPECMDAFADLTTPVAYISGFALLDVPPVMAELVDTSGHDPILMCADDCIVTQGAVDAVLELLDDGHPVVTGWCRLDRTHDRVNLSSAPSPTRARPSPPTPSPPPTRCSPTRVPRSRRTSQG